MKREVADLADDQHGVFTLAEPAVELDALFLRRLARDERSANAACDLVELIEVLPDHDDEIVLVVREDHLE